MHASHLKDNNNVYDSRRSYSAYYSQDTDHGTPRSGYPMKTEWKSFHVDGACRREFLPSLRNGVKANDSQRLAIPKI